MDGTHDMSGMDGMSGTNESSMVMTMMVVFQNNMATSLYSTSWTPSTTGAYAGTCIFIIILAATLRGLLALKWWMEERWLDRELKRRYVVVEGRPGLPQRLSSDTLAKRATLSENGVEESVVVVEKHKSQVRPWRLSIDPLRALIDTVIAGVGYLLMLAVMSMNVGYFMSVLGGTFLGSVVFGRYSLSAAH